MTAGRSGSSIVKPTSDNSRCERVVHRKLRLTRLIEEATLSMARVVETGERRIKRIVVQVALGTDESYVTVAIGAVRSEMMLCTVLALAKTVALTRIVRRHENKLRRRRTCVLVVADRAVCTKTTLLVLLLLVLVVRMTGLKLVNRDRAVLEDPSHLFGVTVPSVRLQDPVSSARRTETRRARLPTFRVRSSVIGMEQG